MADDADLVLLPAVRWKGEPIAAERTQQLLAALVDAGPRGAVAAGLVGEIWADDVPADPAKALQVVVSRTRRLIGDDALVRIQSGYRLGLDAAAVDAWSLVDRLRLAGAAADAGDWPTARRHAEDVCATAIAPDAGASESADPSDSAPTDSQTSGAAAAMGPLGRVRASARAHQVRARSILALALAAVGDDATAVPMLEREVCRHPHDEALLAALLRSESRVRGTGAALERFERYRRDLAQRLGTDPGAAVQRVHAELLAADRPVRDGVRFEENELIGRADDLSALRGLLAGSRVVTLLGAGGLGKTRLAHTLARDATEPVVRFVELVGVRQPDALIPTVAAAVGARAVTPPAGGIRRSTDPRTAIVEALSGAPSLLVLDNCEQIAEAVADLVAVLVAHTRDLTVLITSRASLGIRAERVYPLPVLGRADGVQLFSERATAARPGVVLDRELVGAVVDRLDAIPLAIELAASRTGTMSVQDLLDRLAERFAVLRTTRPDVEDRHRTLQAVIEWSWDLLRPDDRAALPRMARFADGFDLAAAQCVLPDLDAETSVDRLVSQSLLGVDETDGVRFRMLETVREFALERLADSDDLGAATRATRTWAVEFCRAHWEGLYGPDQVQTVRSLRREEANLDHELQRAVRDADPGAVAVLSAALLTLWRISGDHDRIMSQIQPIGELLADADVPADAQDAARLVLASTVVYAALMRLDWVDAAVGRLADLGPGDDPRIAAAVRTCLALSDDYPLDEQVHEGLRRLCDDEDRYVAAMALRWRVNLSENSGDLADALACCERALSLTRPELDGPYDVCELRSLQAQLLMQRGDWEASASAAQLALPTMAALGADADVVAIRVFFALADIGMGRLDAAEAGLAEIEGELANAIGSWSYNAIGELALARGDAARGIAEHRAGLALARTQRLTVGGDTESVEPWVVFELACCLSTLARYGAAQDGADLMVEALAALHTMTDEGRTYLDFPVIGSLAFAAGRWLLRNGPGERFDDAVRLLVLAEAFEYNRGMPSMGIAAARADAERRAPGRWDRMRAEVDPTQRLPQLRAVASRLGHG